MNAWSHIYDYINPIAIKIGFISIHWYGIMYVLALLTGLWFAKWIVDRDRLSIEKRLLDNYFIWLEIGVLLGARIWYILFYDPYTSYYLSHPWQIFNPFFHGEFIGIRGMSYHGAIVGVAISSYLFSKRHPNVTLELLDVVALAIPVGFIFGRVGNFLNRELGGNITELPWGIYVDGVLRHPSQLYEALLEGLLIAVILYGYRERKKFKGELILLYGVLYSLVRFTVEFWRAPDIQIGYLYSGWLTLGQIQSTVMFFLFSLFYILKHKKKDILVRKTK